MQVGDILKQIRKAKKMNQDNVCKGIISRQSYSKIENNQYSPNLDILIQLLERLNANPIDYLHILTKDKNYTDNYKLFIQSTSNSLNIAQAQNLHEQMRANIDNSLANYLWYCNAKICLHQNYPNDIDFLSQDDIHQLQAIIKKINVNPTYLELKALADFGSLVLPYKQLLKIFKKVKKNEEDLPSEFSYLYRKELYKLYNNVCDIAIHKQDLTTAKEILAEYEAFIRPQNDIRQLLYIRIHRITLTYKETHDIMCLNELLELSKWTATLGDTPTAKAIEYQVTCLNGDKVYQPINAVTYE